MHVIPSTPCNYTDQCWAVSALYGKMNEPPACSRTVLPPYPTTTKVKTRRRLSVLVCSQLLCRLVGGRHYSDEKNFDVLGRFVLLFILRCRLVWIKEYTYCASLEWGYLITRMLWKRPKSMTITTLQCVISASTWAVPKCSCRRKYTCPLNGTQFEWI